MLPNFAGSIIIFAVAGSTAAQDCHADNCMRAMRATQTLGRLESVQEFCQIYTAAAGSAANSVAIPTYAALNCGGANEAPSRISSACSCLAVLTTPSMSASRSSSQIMSQQSRTLSTVHTTSSSLTATTTSMRPPTTSSNPTEEPCARVSKSLAGGAFQTVAASLAYECLQSVPLGKDEAVQLVDAIRPYLDWQSTEPYLADPPSEYPFKPFDAYKELDRIRGNLDSGAYEGEYEFQVDLYESTFMAAHDGHHLFVPDLLAAGILFLRNLSLVSISDDGKSLPVIRQTSDVLQGINNNIVIDTINGIDAPIFIEQNLVKYANLQDVDAGYNTQFFSRGNSNANGFCSRSLGQYVYDGDNITVGLTDGREVTVDNYAYITTNFSGVTDGKSMYDKFCNTKTRRAEDTPSKVSDAAATTLNQRDGYPDPVIRTSDSITAGYFLTGQGYEDVAVLSILSFEGERGETLAVIKEFLKRCKKAGRTKLLLDLQGNPGGHVLQAYDVFQALFPQLRGDAVGVFRHSDSLDAVAQALGESDTEPWGYRTDLNLTFDHFPTFESKFAPHRFQGNYTGLIRWDTAEYGVASVVPGAKPPFASDDIILLYDGYCASTCTILSQMLRLQGNVKSVTFGGRPSTGPIQGVGGVKGPNIYSWDLIHDFAKQAKGTTADPSIKARLEALSDLPLRRSGFAANNVRNAILPSNYGDYVPSQFVVENANCRLYWTREMIQDESAVWQATADAAFHNAKCISGGITYTKAASQPAKSGSGTSNFGPVLLSGAEQTPPHPADYWYNFHQTMIQAPIKVKDTPHFEL